MPGLTRKVNHLLFADDLILLASNNDELHKLVRITVRWANKYRLEINDRRLKSLHFTHANTPI